VIDLREVVFLEDEAEGCNVGDICFFQGSVVGGRDVFVPQGHNVALPVKFLEFLDEFSSNLSEGTGD
jgi:hypothetical protein